MFLLTIYVLIRGRAWSAGKADPAAQDRNQDRSWEAEPTCVSFKRNKENVQQW